MKKKLMQLYCEWMETGRIPDTGLCLSLPKKAATKFEKIFTPRIGFMPSDQYWGYDGSRETAEKLYHKDFHKLAKSFTPLRQTLMLLLIEIVDD